MLVLNRRKFFHIHTQAMEMLDLILVAAKWHDPVEEITDCSDAKDNVYLELALASGADCIISGDKKHLLVLNPWRDIGILSPADFMSPDRAEPRLLARIDAEILERYGVIEDEQVRLEVRNRMKVEYLSRGRNPPV